MRKTVDEIMNRAVFYLRPSDTCSDALRFLAALQVGGAAVAREDGRPLGIVSWRDLVHHGRERVDAHMMSPPRVIAEDATTDEAARMLAESGLDRLVVVNRGGRIAGALTTVDVLMATSAEVAGTLLPRGHGPTAKA
jgi:CBS domain-containing protein